MPDNTNNIPDDLLESVKTMTAIEAHKEALRAKIIGVYRAPLKKKRSTYNQRGADTFRPFFDQVLQSNEPMLIEYDLFPSNTVQTLYKKVVDALKFLCEEGDDARTRDVYRVLRYTVRISIEQEGILISLARSRRGLSRSTDSTKEVQARKFLTWKEEFHNWLENATSGDIFDRSGQLALDGTDIDMIKNLCEAHGLIAKVDITGFRAMK